MKEYPSERLPGFTCGLSCCSSSRWACSCSCLSQILNTRHCSCQEHHHRLLRFHPCEVDDPAMTSVALVLPPGVTYAIIMLHIPCRHEDLPCDVGDESTLKAASARGSMKRFSFTSMPERKPHSRHQISPTERICSNSFSSCLLLA